MTVSQRSLFRRLLGGFLLVMLGIWLCVLALAIRENSIIQTDFKTAENKGWTRQILINMQSVAERPDQIARVGVQIEALRHAMNVEAGFDSPPVLIQVWKGEQLAYASLPALPGGLARPLRTGPALGAGWVSWVAADPATGITVRRDAAVANGWIYLSRGAGSYFTPLLYSFPFLLLPAWIMVRRGLRPLEAMADAIEARSSADLSPLPLSPYRELAPLVKAVNSLMQRLTERLEREQHFLTDAAHELKTPLAVIQTNAHLLLGAAAGGACAGGPAHARLHAASDGLRQGVARATHTVHQLLAMARAAPDRDDGPGQPMALDRFLRERLAMAAPLAMQRSVEIELDAPLPCSLALHRESLAALIDNLVDNAIKHSPDGGRVAVSLHECGNQVRLTVGDQGPGIPAALRKKVFQRFYRVPGQDRPGSGLGLSIAERAAARNRAGISLHDPESGPGLLVVVEFSTLGSVPTFGHGLVS